MPITNSYRRIRCLTFLSVLFFLLLGLQVECAAPACSRQLRWRQGRSGRLMWRAPRHNRPPQDSPSPALEFAKRPAPVLPRSACLFHCPMQRPNPWARRACFLHHASRYSAARRTQQPHYPRHTCERGLYIRNTIDLEKLPCFVQHLRQARPAKGVSPANDSGPWLFNENRWPNSLHGK